MDDMKKQTNEPDSYTGENEDALNDDFSMDFLDELEEKKTAE
jgi:hypothetical protein